MQYSTQKGIKQEILKKEVKQSIAEGMTKEERHRPKCPMETILDFFLVIKKSILISALQKCTYISQ